MIIMKFGGTSVEDARAMENVIRIVTREQSRKPVVVLSAIAGATNTLLRSAHIALDGNLDDAHAELNVLLERHVTLLENLIDDRPEVQQLILTIRKRLEDLKTLCQGIAILGELTNRSLDAIASVGEQLSTLILSRSMAVRGLPVELIDARKFMITDGQFTAAAPAFDQITQRANDCILPAVRAGKIVVTQGFIGSTSKGITTTLGRGGSDYSAAIIGAALGAEEIQIWTDVDGVLTADPRIAEETESHLIPRSF
jgi:aspartate kinase